MTKRNAIVYGVLGILGVACAWALFVILPMWSRPGSTPSHSATSGPESVTRRITARLFFVAEDGVHLEALEREVVYGEGTVEQANRILEAQLGPPPEPYTSAIPTGTMLRAVFVSAEGEAYVDLSREVVSAHPGGSLNELFTVYTIVNVLTANLPAISAVQILVDGKEVDTLAGHIDLRRPLQENARWVANIKHENPQ